VDAVAVIDCAASVLLAPTDFVCAVLCNSCCALRWELFNWVEANAVDMVDPATSPIAMENS
jgi:hypothetical protein